MLCYSLIMLNTDAHSSQIKKKMTQQEFVNMNRGTNDSGDLPTAFLESLYQGITGALVKEGPPSALYLACRLSPLAEYRGLAFFGALLAAAAHLGVALGPRAPLRTTWPTGWKSTSALYWDRLILAASARTRARVL